MSGKSSEGKGAGLERLPSDAKTEDIVAALLRDGGVVVHEQVPSETADQVLAELREDFDRVGNSSQGHFNGYKTLRLGTILARSRTSAELIGHPRVMEVADAILLPNCVNYQIGSTAAIEIHPGEEAQMLHKDDDMYPIRVVGMELQISAMWALCEFTEENGATRLIPGSHKVMEQFPRDESVTVSGPMPKGSVFYYMGSVLHGGGANRSTAARAGLVNTYALGWLRPEDNHLLAIPREIADSYPEHIRRLMGYQASGSLGLYPGDPDGTWGRKL